LTNLSTNLRTHLPLGLRCGLVTRPHLGADVLHESRRGRLEALDRLLLRNRLSGRESLLAAHLVLLGS
jgi:hypothetical protein